MHCRAVVLILLAVACSSAPRPLTHACQDRTLPPASLATRASETTDIPGHTVSGVVVEAPSGEAMAEVPVSFRSTGSRFRRELATDSLGRFVFDSLPVGFGLLHASELGYQAPGVSVTVSPEYGHDVKFVLAASPVCLHGTGALPASISARSVLVRHGVSRP